LHKACGHNPEADIVLDFSLCYVSLDLDYVREHKCWFTAEQDDKAHFWGNYSTQYTLWKLKHTSLSSSMASYSNNYSDTQKLRHMELICKVIPSKLRRVESGKFKT